MSIGYFYALVPDFAETKPFTGSHVCITCHALVEHKLVVKFNTELFSILLEI